MLTSILLLYCGMLSVTKAAITHMYAVGATGEIGPTGHIGDLGYPYLPKLKRCQNIVLPRDFDIVLQSYGDPYMDLQCSLNLKYAKHKYFSILCSSLDSNNDVHMSIKEIIVSHITYDTKIDKIYDKVMRDIFECGFYDFTIMFKNGKTIKCMKMLLKLIPYFDMVLSEFGDENIIINDDYDLVLNIIKILHGDNDVITDNNLIDLYLLMDKFLMCDYFDVLMSYGSIIDGKLKIQIILQQLLDVGDYDKLIKFKMLAQYNKNEKLCVLNSLRFTCMTLDMQVIFDNILHLDYGENIYIYDDWDNIFDKYKKDYTEKLIWRKVYIIILKIISYHHLIMFWILQYTMMDHIHNK